MTRTDPSNPKPGQANQADSPTLAAARLPTSTPSRREEFPLSTEEAAAVLRTAEPYLAETVRLGYVTPPPPIVAGQRQWSAEQLRQAGEALARQTASDLRSQLGEESSAAEPHYPSKFSKPSINDRIEEARRAIARGWALIPDTGASKVHKRWEESPPPTIETVVRWLKEGHNLSLRTGNPSGLIVLSDESDWDDALVAHNLPKTPTAISGEGRTQLYFKAPAFKVPNLCDWLDTFIDVIGDGGLVMLVGSIHPITGYPDTWAPGLSPEEVEIAELPANLIERLRADSASYISYIRHIRAFE